MKIDQEVAPLRSHFMKQIKEAAKDGRILLSTLSFYS